MKFVSLESFDQFLRRYSRCYLLPLPLSFHNSSILFILFVCHCKFIHRKTLRFLADILLLLKPFDCVMRMNFWYQVVCVWVCVFLLSESDVKYVWMRKINWINRHELNKFGISQWVWHAYLIFRESLSHLSRSHRIFGNSTTSIFIINLKWI